MTKETENPSVQEKYNHEEASGMYKKNHDEGN